MLKKYQFDVALSFANEDRKYIEKVARYLSKMEIKLFYDKFEEVNLWGKNLYDFFHKTFSSRAKYTVMFISKHYAKKLWSTHERKCAQEKAFRSNKEYILPARFDRTKIPGILDTTGYIELKGMSPKMFAEKIKEKIGRIDRTNFLPDVLDNLYPWFEANSKIEKYKIYALCKNFFEALSLMTIEERRVLFYLIENACPEGLPENFHMNLEYLSRISKLSVPEIRSIFSRLSCLGFRAEVKRFNKYSRDSLCKESDIIEVKLDPRVDIGSNNESRIVLGIITCMRFYLCPNCYFKAFVKLDFSILSEHTGFSDKDKQNKSFSKILGMEKRNFIRRLQGRPLRTSIIRIGRHAPGIRGIRGRDKEGR